MLVGATARGPLQSACNDLAGQFGPIPAWNHLCSARVSTTLIYMLESEVCALPDGNGQQRRAVTEACSVQGPASALFQASFDLHPISPLSLDIAAPQKRRTQTTWTRTALCRNFEMLHPCEKHPCFLQPSCHMVPLHLCRTKTASWRLVDGVGTAKSLAFDPTQGLG